MRWGCGGIATAFFGLLGYTESEKGGEDLRVYLDLAVFLNACVDFLLLSGTNRLSGYPPDLSRTLSAAAFGGIYSGACLIKGFRFLAGGIWRIVFLALMMFIAFGCGVAALRRCGIFLLLSAALGGITLGMVRTGIAILLVAAVGIWALCILAAGNGVGANQFVPVKLCYGNQKVEVTALRDSGNTLRDPVTGECVLVIGASSARKLTGLSQEQLEHPLQTLSGRAVPGLRLIPFESVGSSGGMMLALRVNDVTVGKRKRSTIVAFAPSGLDGAMGYEALTGGV